MRFKRLRGKCYLMEAGVLQCYGPGSIYSGEKAALGASMDQWEQLDPDPEPPAPPEPLRGLFPRARGFRGKGEWDVINPETGEPINYRPLTKSEAMNIVGNDGLDELEMRERVDADTGAGEPV